LGISQPRALRPLLRRACLEGTRRSTLEELTDWTLWADKTLGF
jgi:hypothetical protein